MRERVKYVYSTAGSALDLHTAAGLLAVCDVPFTASVKQVGMLIIGSNADATGAVVSFNIRWQAGVNTNDSNTATGS